jgi:predicted dehydrogenase
MSKGRKPLKVGLVGFGSAGKNFHAPLISATPNLELSFIISSQAQHDPYINQNYPTAQRATDFKHLLQNPEVNLIVLATPNETHFPLAKQALKNGKHVIIDKPFTISSRQAYELDQLASEQKLVLSVFHNRRWDGDFLTVKKLLQQNSLGQVVQFSSNFDRFRPKIKDNWREENNAGSGLLYDLGSHLLDQALQLFGEPHSLYAAINKQRPHAVTDDFFLIHLYYPDVLIELSAGQLASAPTPRFKVLGTKGGYQVFGLDPQENQLKNNVWPGTADFGKTDPESYGRRYSEDEPIGIPVPTEIGTYTKFYQNILSTIWGEAELEVTARQAARVIELIELATESNRLKKVVSVK